MHRRRNRRHRLPRRLPRRIRENAGAHAALAAAFCDECAHGIPGCEELFFVRDSEWGLGTLLIPFSADILDEVQRECLDGFTCAFDFPGCAEDVIASRLTLEDSRACLSEIL